MTIEERVERLERQNHRLRRGLGLLVAAVLAGCGLGLSAEESDELTLRKLTMIDEEGRVRIVLGAPDSPPGAYKVQHFDTTGKRRISAWTARNGAAGVTLNGAESGVRMSMTTVSNGTAKLELSDTNGRTRIQAKTTRSGFGALALCDTEERCRVRLQTDPEGGGTVEHRKAEVKDDLEPKRLSPI
jgi:hypothetical protein